MEEVAADSMDSMLHIVKLSEAQTLRLQKDDILQVVIRSDDVDERVIRVLGQKYRDAIQKALGPDNNIQVVVIGIGEDDNVFTSIVRMEK